MSDPRPTPAEPRPRSRSRWRKLARLAAVVTLAGLGSLALALVLLHTPFGRGAVKRLLETNGGPALGGKLRLGSLRYQLWAGTLDASALHLKRNDMVLEAAELHVRWSPRGGLHLRLERPTLVVRDNGGSGAVTPATGLAAAPWVLLARFADVEIAGARLELQDQSGVPYLLLGRLDATMQESHGQRSIRITLRSGAVTPPGGRQRLPLSAMADLHLAGNRLVIDALHLATEGATLDLHGTLARLQPNEGDASVLLDCEGALATLFAPNAALSGRVRAQADVQLRGSLSGQLRASSPALTVQGVGPWETSLRGRFDSWRMVVESVDALGYGGRFSAQGPISFDGTSRTDLVLRAEGVDAAALARDAAGTDLPVRARLDFRLRWITSGLDLGRARGEGEAALHPLSAPAPGRHGERPGLALAGATRILVEGRQLQLNELRLESRGALVAADVALSPGHELQGRYRVELPLESLPALAADLGASERLPALVGRLVAEGRISGKAGDPLATVHVQGEGIATATAARSATTGLAGDGRFAGGRLTLGSLVVRSSSGGQAVLAGGIPLTPAGGDWGLVAEIQALDLAPFLAAVGVGGRSPLDGEVRVTGPRSQPTAHAELDARLAVAGAKEPIRVSLSGSSSGTRFAVERLEATLAGGRVLGQGSFDAQSRAIAGSIHAEGMRLARLPSWPATLSGLDGALAAEVTLAGTAEAPAGEAHASLSEGRLDASPLPGLTLTARADGKRLELVGASSDPARPGAESVFLRGGGPLQGSWPLRLQIDAAAVPLQLVLDAIPAAHQQATSLTLQGEITLELPLRQPAELRYASDALVAQGRVQDVEWKTESFRIEGAIAEATVGGLRLTATSSSQSSPPPGSDRATVAESETRPAAGSARQAVSLAGGTLELDGRIAFSASRSFDLAVAGGVDLGALQRLANTRLAGAAKWQLRVRGTRAAPDLAGQLTVEDGRGRIGSVRVSGLQLLARLRGAEADIERFEAGMLGGRLTASGALPLRQLAAGAAARFHFEASDLDLSRLAFSSAERDPEAPSFLVSVTGDVDASVPGLDTARGHGQLTRVEEQSPEGRLSLAAPAEWTLVRGLLVLKRLRLEGALGNLEAQAELRVAGGPFAGSALVAGPLDLRAVGPFLPDTTLAGPARVDLRAAWDQKAVRLDGGVTVENGRLTLEQLAFTLTGLKGELRLLGDHATLTAGAASGDGRLTLSGGMSFGSRLLGPAQLNLEAQQVLISYPEGFRARAGGVVRLSGGPGAYRIKGELDLTQPYFTAEFDQKKASLDRLDWQLQALQGSQSLGESLPLSLHVRFADPLRIRNKRAQLDVAGGFTVSGTLARPTAAGQVSLLEGGTVRIRRGDVRIQQGHVELNDYPAGNPELDVTGISQLAGIEMDVHARGTFEDLQLEIASPNRPDLSQTDLVSLLLTGRTAQTAAAQSTTIVAEELASALGGVIQRNVGELLLVDVGPERSLLTDGVDPTQRFSLGARLRQDLIVLYSTRLDGTERRWIVEWNPRGGRLRLRVLDDQTEGLALEVADRLSFNLFKRTSTPLPRESAKLAVLRIEGDVQLPQDQLRAAAGLKIGQRAGTLRSEQAADSLRRSLVAQGWLGATVDAESAPVAAGSRSIQLTLRIHGGARIRISWAGDDPGKKLRAQALAAWPAYASPEGAAAVVARAVRVLLQADRYYLAQVGQEIRTHEDGTEVVLRVEKGSRGRGVVLDFEGNTVLGDATLRANLPKPGSHEFFEALAGAGSRLRGALRIAYAKVGYLHAGVLNPRSVFDPASGRLRVVIPIRERGASRVSELVLPQELRDAAAEAPTLLLRQGRPFDLDAYIADRDKVAAWYRNAGWMEARVRGVLEPAGDELRVRLEVAPGPRLRADKIRIESQGRTASGMIRRAVVVKPGTIVRPQQLAESRARLSELGVFRSVDVRPVPPQGGDDEADDAAEDRAERISDIAVSYVERPDVTLEYGLRYSASGAAAGGEVPSSPAAGRLQLTGALDFANPFGWGWHLRPFALLTSDRHTLGVALESATLFGLRVRSRLLASDDSSRRTDSSLASRIKGVSLQLTRALLEDTSPERRHDRLRLQWGYADKRIEYFDSDATGSTLAGRRCYVTLSLVGDERDSLTEPHRGLFWTTSADLARTAFGSDVNYLRLYGQLFTYLPLPARMVWAQGYRAGVTPGADPLLLLENRFQAGGPTTVRGYGQNDLGPQTPDGIGLGGQGILILNQELRFPIWSLLAGGVFWDAGNVWRTAGDMSLRDLRQSVGVGLRVMFPFGPVRVEYAWNVGPRRGSRGRFVFGLGHAF